MTAFGRVRGREPSGRMVIYALAEESTRLASSRPHSSRKPRSSSAYLAANGRTSTTPPIRAVGIRAAISSAASRSSTSTKR
jgi:hypothetical protein